MSVSPQHFAEFLQRMGHTVREAGGAWWYNTSRGIYTSFPFDQDIDAASLPLRQILGRDGLVARYGCPPDQGVTSFRFACDDCDYDFPQLRSRTRTQVRRGLEECRVEQIEFDVLRRHGVALNADTLTRQGRRIPGDLESWWTQYYESAAKTPGAEAWGAFAGEELAAYLISFTIGESANILIVRSATSHLKKFPNNALLFQFIHQRIRDPRINRVLYGYESIQPDLGSLDQFKVGMGFQAAACGQRVEVAGWLKPLLNRYTAAPLSLMLKQLSHGETSAKLRGILRWYQQQPALTPVQLTEAWGQRAA